MLCNTSLGLILAVYQYHFHLELLLNQLFDLVLCSENALASC